jgi:metacaspase-1
MAKGISINIGLNSVNAQQYNGWPGTLVACEFDAKDMSALAKAKGFDSKLLLTANATSTNVTQALTDAAHALSTGDILFISYSGHGGQVPDTNGDEPDAEDETWVLYDRELVDDELYSMWAQFQPGVRIFVLSDSCHSGSVVRAAEFEAIAATPALTRRYLDDPRPRIKAMPLDVQKATYQQHKQLYDDIQTTYPSGEKVSIGASVMLISGCMDDQTSADGRKNGLFTQATLKVWDKGKYKGSYRRFYRDLVKQMPIWQVPNLFKVGAKAPIFEAQTPFTV